MSILDPDAKKVSEHHPFFMYGGGFAWVRCHCGWTAGGMRWRRVQGACVAWARHLATEEARNE